MTGQHSEKIRRDRDPMAIDAADESSFQVSQENYKDALEREIVRRIEIMEAPDYQRVPRFNRGDIIFAAALACLMIVLIVWGGTI